MDQKFSCHYCSSLFDTLVQHAKHQHLHKYDKNFTFKCGWFTCHHSTTSEKTLLQHLRRMKHELGSAQQESTTGPSAPLLECSAALCEVKLESPKLLCQHLSVEHFSKEGNANCRVVCPVEDCTFSSVFHTRNALRSHFSKAHKKWRDSTDGQLSYGSATVGQDCEMDASMEVESNQTIPVTDPCSPSSPVFTSVDDNEAIKLLGKFYLYLEGELMLPATTIQKISEHLSLVSELVQEKISSALLQELTDYGVSKEDSKNIVVKTMACDPLYTSHHQTCAGPSLTSEYLRHEYFKKKFLYFEPQKHFLSVDRVHEECIQHVPISSSLQMLLKDPSIQQQDIESFSKGAAPTNVFKDYTDGLVCINKYGHIKERIDIFLFSDGFSVTNPLGSAKRKHNMEGTYFTLGNLKPNNRSKVDAMHLVSMIPKPFLKKYGYHKSFEPIVEDLKKLVDEGIEFQGRLVAVRLMFIIGDNLGQHQLGGLVGSFRATYFCRFCPIARKDFKANPLLLQPLRTVRDFNRAVFKVISGMKASYLGVKEACVFNQIKDFHIGDPRLAVCLAHDFFLGVVNWDLAFIISYLINKKKWFTYELLNRRIAKFQCIDSDAPNKPASVSLCGSKLGGHAVQNWSLIRLLPFFLGSDLIKDPSDEIWKLYLILKDICDIITAPVLTSSQLDTLSGLINDYIDSAKNLVSMKPKHHFLVHYAVLVRFFGPLIYLFTLRFEHKHQFFKRIIKAANNFINVAHTMTQRHQMHLAYLSTGNIFSPSSELVCSIQQNIAEFSGCIAPALKQQLPPACTFAQTVTFEGLTYKSGQWLIVDQIDCETLKMGQIETVIFVGSDVKFLLQTKLAALLPAYGVYSINQSALEQNLVALKDLKMPLVQPLYDFQDSQCFSLKYAVTGVFHSPL